MRNTKKINIAAMMLAGTLILSSCSSNNDDDMNATPSSSASESTMPDDEMTDGMDMGELPMLMPMGTGDPFVDARTAAMHMPETALTLSSGFVKSAGLEGSVDSEAANLRSDMTALLNEHVYLAGIGVATAYVAGPDSEEFKAAAAVLDENSVALSELIGSISTPEQEEAFLQLWRDHVGYFVNYAVAEKSGDAEAKQMALDDLMMYTTTAGEFFNEVSNGELDAATVSEGLQGHVTTLTAAIDAMAANDPMASKALMDAAMHVSMAAATLSEGLAAGAGLEGDVMDPASTLRANMTQMLSEHVYLASYAVMLAYTTEGGIDSEAFMAAAEALDVNSVAISEGIESVSTPEDAEMFLNVWREHIGYFVDYAVAVAGEDEEAKMMALENFNDYRQKTGDLLEKISDGELPADAIIEGLGHHVETLAGAIDSLKMTLVQ